MRFGRTKGKTLICVGVEVWWPIFISFNARGIFVSKDNKLPRKGGSLQ